MTVRYRVGTSSRDGRPLVGWPHVRQSIGKILMTIPTERVMRHDFGMDPKRRLGTNISPALAASLYRDVIDALRRDEPEFVPRQLQLVSLDRAGGLGLAFTGDYYPEGRFGNYSIVEGRDGQIALAPAQLRGAA